MKFLKVDKPRCLSLEALDWEDNYVVRPLRDCGLADGFMKVWKQQFLGNINQQNGEYSCKNECRRSASSSNTPTSLLPASKRARLNEETTYLDDSSSKGFNESQMDDNIKEHFLGKYTML